MKKGFTLIELLAVIIILAVIALIATPVVLNVVENAKRSANKNSVYGFIDGAKMYYAESLLDGTKKSDINGTTNILDKLNISGSKPDSGEIFINNKGEVAVALVYDDVCYLKAFTAQDLSESDDVANCKIGVESTPGVPTEPEVSCFKYVANETGITILAYTCTDILDVVIPNQIDGKNVTTIGSSAFINKQLTSVVIPNTVTTIKEGAFVDNKILSVIIPNSVTTIEKAAFVRAGLTSVIIPGSVTTIGEAAFVENQLESVVISEGVTSIGSQAFFNNRITSVIIPGSVTTIGKDAFVQNQLESVVISEGVISIGSQAFLNNRITSVIIPGSVTTIGASAFTQNQLTSVTIKEKDGIEDFVSYGSENGALPFDGGWADNYSNSNIIWD